MKTFKPSSITAALIASGVMVFTQPLFAQETDDDTATTSEDAAIETIEVRGFSTSLIKSLNQKRFSDTVTEQLSADDLGALPDVSMADALTRLPGISAVRTGGQAAEINIRGLSGDFVFSTLNGREQVSTSGDRSIEFDQYPSELISSAAVYKSPKASLIEGGVAGSVELQTASPLAQDKQHNFNANIRGMFNDRASEIPGATETGHRISFAYQGKFLDDTLGVALGFARLFQPSAATQFIGLASQADIDVDGLAGDTENPLAECPECEFLSEGFEMQHQGGEETRDGYVAAIEWAPTDNFVLKADAFVSKFDSEEFARGFRVKLDAPTANIINPVVQNNFVTGGTFIRGENGNTRVELVNDDNRDFDQVESYGINADWQVTDNLAVQFDIALSKAESDFRNGLLWALVAEDANAETPRIDQDVQISYQLNGLDLPNLAFNQSDFFTDIDRVMVSQYGIYPFVNEDELDAYRVDFQYQLDNDYFSSIEFGARHSVRDYSNDRSVFQYGSDSGFPSSQPPLRLTQDMVEVVNWEGAFGYFPSYLSIDLNAALASWFPGGIPQPVQSWGFSDGVINLPEGQTGQDTSWSVLESGDVNETVSAAYFMANIDTEVFGMPMTGNIGVRYVDTKQGSSALQRATIQVPNPDGEGTITVPDVANGAQFITDEAGLIHSFFRPTFITHEFTDVLPSINLNFAVTDNSQLRLAAAKVMGRAPINRFAANTSTNISPVQVVQNRDSGERTVIGQAFINGQSRNSPELEPFYATQYDISYETYFTETDGALVVAAFYKDIESFIEDIALNPFDFEANGFEVPDSIQSQVFFEQDFPGQELEPVLDANGDPVFVNVPTVNGRYDTAVNNAEGGYIRGVEIAYTQIFSFLPGMWSGLGLNASYSYTESEIQRTASRDNGVFATDLPGLSNNVINTTIFWEYENFETRLNMRYRDSFVSEQVAVNSQVVNFDEELVVDYQAQYDINDNMSILFQVNNLTDEPTRSFFGSQTQTGTIQYFGTQYFLGLTYSL